MTGLQLFPALDAATEAALRASIERFGVLVPITRDQDGRILDGHHRARIAADLGVLCPESRRAVAGEDEAREIARTLNADRRHLSREQRLAVEQALREDGHSLRAIAGVVGVDHKTVHRDLEEIGETAPIPERVTRTGGGTYPAKRAEPTETDKAVAVAEFPELSELPPKEAVRLAGELRKYPEGPERDRRRKAASTWHRVYNHPPKPKPEDPAKPLYLIGEAADRLAALLDDDLTAAWADAPALLAESVQRSLTRAAKAAADAAKPRTLRRVK